MGDIRGAHVVSVNLKLAAENNYLQERAGVRLLPHRTNASQKFRKLMRDTKCTVAFMDAVCVNHCPAVRQDLDL